MEAVESIIIKREINANVDPLIGMMVSCSEGTGIIVYQTSDNWYKVIFLENQRSNIGSYSPKINGWEILDKYYEGSLRHLVKKALTKIDKSLPIVNILKKEFNIPVNNKLGRQLF